MCNHANPRHANLLFLYRIHTIFNHLDTVSYTCQVSETKLVCSSSLQCCHCPNVSKSTVCPDCVCAVFGVQASPGSSYGESEENRG